MCVIPAVFVPPACVWQRRNRLWLVAPVWPQAGLVNLTRPPPGGLAGAVRRNYEGEFGN